MQIASKVQILSPKCRKYLPNERFQLRDANSKETVPGQKTNTSKRKSALIKKTTSAPFHLSPKLGSLERIRQAWQR
jgi:hypothetical protein